MSKKNNNVFTRDDFKKMVDAIADYGEEMSRRFAELDKSFGKEGAESLRDDFEKLAQDQRKFWEGIMKPPAKHEEHEEGFPPEACEFTDDDVPPAIEDFDEACEDCRCCDEECGGDGEPVFREPADKPSAKVFRGRRKDGEWVEGDLVHVPPKTEIVVHGKDGAVFFHEVEPESVAQSTGLCDFDGKPVFDRDILQARDDSYRVVRYIDRLGGYVLTSPGTPEIVEPGISGLADYRVAGNMFEGLAEGAGSLWN